jgi:hypothetical protein
MEFAISKKWTFSTHDFACPFFGLRKQKQPLLCLEIIHKTLFSPKSNIFNG